MSKYRDYCFSRVVFLVLDITLIAFAFKLSNYLVYGNSDISYQYNIFFILFTLLWCIVSGFKNFFLSVERFLPFEKKLVKVINGFILHAILLISCMVVLKLGQVSRLMLLNAYITATLLISLSRFVFLGLNKFTLTTNRNYSKYVIIGTGHTAVSLFETFEEADVNGEFMGFFDDSPNKSNPYDEQIQGSVTDLKAYCLQKRVDEIYYTLPSNNERHIEDIMNFAVANSINLRVVPDFSCIEEDEATMYFYGI